MIINYTSGATNNYYNLGYIWYWNTSPASDLTPPPGDVSGVVSKTYIYAESSKIIYYADVFKKYILGEISDMDIKIGNREVLQFALTDEDGDTISSLAAAEEVRFQIKSTKTATATVSKTTANGITVDTDKDGNSKTGTIQVILTSTDTNLLTEGFWFMAVQVEWDGNTKEVDITENGVTINQIEVIQDIIN